MLWFHNTQNGELICTETTTLDDLRIQTVLDSGFFLNQKERDPKSHSHLNHELYLVEKGNCITICNNKDIPCNPGDVILIPIGTSHNVRSLSEDAVLYSLRFSCQCISGAKVNSPLYPSLFAHLEKPKQFHSQQLLSILQQLRCEFSSLLPFSTEKIQGLLQAFYAELLRQILNQNERSVISGPASSVYPIISTAKLPGYQDSVPQEYYIDMLDEFFTHLPPETPTLTELADRLHLSVSQTKRLVKTEYGVSFKQKLALARIEHSKFLMTTTQLPLEKIAERVGYNSYNAFFEAFIAQTGYSPSQYRKSQME